MAEINNYFLYSISRPKKSGFPSVDLANDSEAQVPVNNAESTTLQLAVDRVIAKVFCKNNISLDITSDIRNTFKCKLWRMGQALFKLGGNGRNNLIEDWKKTTWTPESLRCRNILSQKRKLELDLKEETVKRRKLELNSLALKKEVKALKDVTNEQAKTIVSLKSGDDTCRRQSTRNWSSYSSAHRSVKRKSIASDIKALSICNEHFTPLSVELKNIESGEKETVDIESCKFTTTKRSCESRSSEDMVHFSLFVKDQFSLSDSAWRELSQLSSDLPSLSQVKKLSAELNSSYAIVPSPNGHIGVQQSFKSRLLYRVQKLTLKPGETIKVKLTGDGTYIAKHLHVVNVAFTLLNEGPLASSPVGNHSIAILQVSEDYDSLSSSLTQIIDEASELQNVNVNGSEHQIKFFLGGDMKFLAIVCGIGAANARYACIWCKCPSETRWDMSKTWSAFDPSKGARTVEEIKRFMTLPKAKRTGCQAKPLFEFIPIDHVMIDSLHLYLRVSDLLTNLLIQDLRRLDGISKALDRTTHNNLAAYETFLNEVCGIHFKWYSSKETKQLEWRDLSGPEKIRLFKHIDIPKYFPDLPNASVIQDIWKEFSRLFKELENADINCDNFQSDVKNWVKLFLRIYQTKNITPYIHSFANHVPEFITKYGGLNQFTQQGLEKLNDLTTKHYLRSSNHRNAEALKQVLSKRNRLEELADDGFKREVRLYHCSTCGDEGHNKRCCPNSRML